MDIKQIRRLSQMVLPLPRAWKASRGEAAVKEQLSAIMMPGCRALDAYLRPDFGWDAAMSIYKFGYQKNGFLDGVSKWVHIAVVCLERGLKTVADDKCQAVQWAWKTRHDTHAMSPRLTLEGALVVEGATRESTAKALGLPLDYVTAYETLFWNVTDRSKDLAYLQQMVYPSGRLEEMTTGYFQKAGIDKTLIRMGYNSGVEDLKWGAGHRFSSINTVSASEAKEQNERLTLAIGAMMLRNFGHFQEQHVQVSSSRQLIQAAKLGGIDESSGGGDDDFAKFAESLLTQDVNYLQEQIREKMNASKNSLL